MLKLINKHPFISGFIMGFFGVGFIGKRLKKYVAGKVTIIQLEITDVTDDLHFEECPSLNNETISTGTKADSTVPNTKTTSKEN